MLCGEITPETKKQFKQKEKFNKYPVRPVQRQKLEAEQQQRDASNWSYSSRIKPILIQKKTKKKAQNKKVERCGL